MCRADRPRDCDAAPGNGNGGAEIADPGLEDVQAREQVELATPLAETLGQGKATLDGVAHLRPVAAGEHGRNGERLLQDQLCQPDAIAYGQGSQTLLAPAVAFLE